MDDEIRFEAIQYEPKLGLAVECLVDGISCGGCMRAIQYEQKLSLAVERLVDGITIEQLWRVV